MRKTLDVALIFQMFYKSPQHSYFTTIGIKIAVAGRCGDTEADFFSRCEDWKANG